MDSALVIKVKYGDSLRRFSARVDENNQLDLDMVRLRAKILSLFNIPADANFILRYVDEDGDLVALLDDDDLRDVMRQRLKFLRIDVHMSDDSVGKSNASSSGSATPLRSPTVPNQFLSGNVAIADALKSVPDPLLKALSNLSLDFVSKAASSSPVIATLADCISKTGPSILNSDCQPLAAAGRSSKSGVPEEPVTDERIVPQSTCLESNSSASQQVEAGNLTRDVVAGVASVDPNILPCEPYPSQATNVNTKPLASAVPVGDGKKGEASTGDGFAVAGGSSGTSTSYAAPDNISTHTTAMGPTSNLIAECPFSGTYITHSVVPSFGNHHKRSHNHTHVTGGVFHKGISCDGCGVYPITGPRFKSKVKENYDLCSICLNEMGNMNDYIRMDRPLSVRCPQSFEGVYKHHLCRTGAILKHAKPKLDSRFILDVNVIDGMIMAPSTAFTKIWRMQNNGTLVWPKGTQLVWIGGDMLSDSQSVDLEIPEDGVPVDKELDIAVELRAPQLPGQYLSYWRMAYPSGQNFGQRIWVLIQVDPSLKDSFYDGSQGLNLNIPCDASGSRPQVIDINVQPNVDDVFLQPHNSTAPTEPVKQKVDEQPSQEPENDFSINESTFNGHSVSPSSTSVAPSYVSYPIIDFSETALVVPSNQQSLAVDGHSASPPETSVAPSSVSYPIIDLSETAPVVPSNQQSLAVDGHSASPPETSVAPSSVSYPIIDFSETAPVVPSNQQSLAVDALSSSMGIGGNNSVEEALLKELEEMGFKQVDLNKEILRMNEYNLEQSVDDLCSASEWDRIYEELQQ